MQLTNEQDIRTYCLELAKQVRTSNNIRDMINDANKLYQYIVHNMITNEDKVS